MKNSKVIRHTFESLALAFVFLAAHIPNAEAEQFSIIVLPDTQSYLNGNAAIFAAQTQWIADNAVAENIIYVTHLGDIVDTISCNPTDTHWQTANNAFTTLDSAGIPYGIHPGNHDYDIDPGNNPCTATQPTDKYNDGTLGTPGFGADRYPSPPYGPAAEQFDPSPVSPTKKNDNNFLLFASPGGEKFISLNLAWSNVSLPAVLAWADTTLKLYPDRKALVTSHQIAGQRGGSGPCPGATGVNFSTYGDDMWDELKDNPNLYMMLSGHCRGETYFRMSGGPVPFAEGATDSARACMSDVHVMMSNYQFINYTGGAGDPSTGSLNTGYLRIMRFDTIANTVDIETYSPWIDTYPGGSLPATGANLTIAGMGQTTASTFTIPYETAISPSGVVLLPDTSGSMGWGVDGTFIVPENEKRITFAKQAASVFVDLMFIAPSTPTVSNLGLATFPAHPWVGGVGTADRLIDMTLFDASLQATMLTAISNDLTPSGGTPMLFGLEDADDMMDGMDCRAIVLLSDGAHNTPTNASVGSPEVTATLAALGVGGSDITQVYAINFAGPTEGDIPLLQDIAAQTDPDSIVGVSSQFFDATTDIAGGVFDVGLGLTAIFEKVLADVLELDIGVDPMDTIGFGETRSFFQAVGELDEKVTFVVSWRPGEAALGVTVFDASGNVVNPGDDGVDVISRASYVMFSVGKKGLIAAGRIGPAPWRVDVSHLKGRCEFRECDDVFNEGPFDDVVVAFHDDVGNGDHDDDDDDERQLYQYSTILDSGLKLITRLGRNNYAVGDTIKMTAELVEGRRPILGLKDIQVVVSAPGDGKGNWYAAHAVTAEQLASVPMQVGDEVLTPIHRKGLFLTGVAQVAYPARMVQRSFQLFDDGTNSDEVAGDGIYTNTFADTLKEGIYSFYFKAAGPTRFGNSFARENLKQQHLAVRTIADAVELTAILLASNALKNYDFSVIPKDSIGNYVGPGFAANIALNTTTGKFEGPIRDNLDGSYTQLLALNPDDDEDKVNIIFNIGGAQKTVNLGAVLRGDEPELLMCDANFDEAVDIIDIRAISANRNQPATGPDDPMDWDQNGVIDVRDARGCMRSCTLPRCRPARK